MAEHDHGDKRPNQNNDNSSLAGLILGAVGIFLGNIAARVCYQSPLLFGLIGCVLGAFFGFFADKKLRNIN